jgi:hypothetical protein
MDMSKYYPGIAMVFAQMDTIYDFDFKSSILKDKNDFNWAHWDRKDKCAKISC